MNLHEWALQLGVILAVAIVIVWLVRRSRATARSVAALNEQLALYTETSITLAATVQRVLLTPERAPQPATSRRYMLRQARLAAEDGQPIERVAGEYRLSSDEVRLLAASARAKTGESPRRASPDADATRGYAADSGG